RLGDAVRREHDGPSRGNFVELVDEYRTLRSQVVDDELVVDDFVANIDRRTELRERLFDDCDRTIDAGAKAAGVGEQHLHRHAPFLLPSGRESRDRLPRKLSRISSAAPTVMALSATLNAGYAQPS